MHLKSSEKEILFNDIQNILLADTIEESMIGYVLCYFKLNPTNEAINFLLNNLGMGSIINQAIASCSAFDVLIEIGKPVHIIAKEHILLSKNYYEFHTIVSIISITGNWNEKKKEKYIENLKNENEVIKAYCEKWLNGDIK